MPNKKKHKRKSTKSVEKREKQDCKETKTNDDQLTSQKPISSSSTRTRTTSTTSTSIQADSNPSISTEPLNPHQTTPIQNNHSMSIESVSSDQDRSIQADQAPQSLYTDAKSWVDRSPSNSTTSVNLDEGYLTALDTPVDSQSNQNFSNHHHHQLEEEQDKLSLQALDQHLSSLLSEEDPKSNMNQTLLDAMNPNPLPSKFEVGKLPLTESQHASGLNRSSEGSSLKIPASSLEDRNDTKSDIELNGKVYSESVSEQSTGKESQNSSLIDPIRSQPITSPTSVDSDLPETPCQTTPTLAQPTGGIHHHLDQKEPESKDAIQNTSEDQAVDQPDSKINASDPPSDSSPPEPPKAELQADHKDANATPAENLYHVEKNLLASDIKDPAIRSSLASTDGPSSDHMVSLDATPTTNTVLTSSSGCTNDDTFITSKSHSRPEFETAVLSSSMMSSGDGAALPMTEKESESQSLASKSVPSGSEEPLAPVVNHKLNEEPISSLSDPLIDDVKNDSGEGQDAVAPLPTVDATTPAPSVQDDLSPSKPVDEGTQPSTLAPEDVASVESHQFGSDTGLVKMMLDDSSSPTITSQSPQPAISSILPSTSGPNSQDPNAAIEEKVMGHHSSQIELVDQNDTPPTLAAEPECSTITPELINPPTPPPKDSTDKEPTTITAELISPPTPLPTNDGPNEPSPDCPQPDTTSTNDTQPKENPTSSMNRSRSMSKKFFKSLNHRKESNKTNDHKNAKTLKPTSTITEASLEEKGSTLKSTLKKKRSLSGLKQKAVNSWNGRNSNQSLHLKEPLPDLTKFQDLVNHQKEEVSTSAEPVVKAREEPSSTKAKVKDEGTEKVEKPLNEKVETDEAKGEEVITRVNEESRSNSNSGLSPMKLFKRTILNKKHDPSSTSTSSPSKTQPTWRLSNKPAKSNPTHPSERPQSTWNPVNPSSRQTPKKASHPNPSQELNSGGIGYSPNLTQGVKKSNSRHQPADRDRDREDDDHRQEKRSSNKEHYRFSGILSKIFR
ncbi:hypothetical protein DFH28DRAFT_943022 [Melampsora americana]|nr:hypothetical protein DFH28DRAFT_943022 [Melampsora americana]